MIPQRNLSHLSNRLADGGSRRVPETVLERDYCLSWFLVGLSRSPLRDRLAFKGGTALKKCYFADYCSMLSRGSSSSGEWHWRRWAGTSPSRKHATKSCGRSASRPRWPSCRSSTRSIAMSSEPFVRPALSRSSGNSPSRRVCDREPSQVNLATGVTARQSQPA